MLRGRVFSIRGTVLDNRNGPALTQLTLTPKVSGIPTSNSRMGATMQQSSGAFEFRGLLPGTYVLQMLRPAQVSRTPGDAVASNPGLAGRMEVTVSNSDVEGVVFALLPTAEITGSIRMEDGSSVSAFILLTDTEQAAGTGPSQQTKPDGTFRIQNLGFSRYSASVNPLPPGAYVKSVRFGGQDSTKTLLDLTSGAGGVLEIVLSLKAAEVTAMVRTNNGESVPGVTVSLWSKTANAAEPAGERILTSSSDGSIKFGGLRPGEYYVAAWEEVDSNLLRYPDFLARFNDQATEVKVGESDKVSVNLTLIPKDKIAAEVAKLP
jgi:hypothetical protein